jgi:hypothetical protein
MEKRKLFLGIIFTTIIGLSACKKDETATPIKGKDINTATKVEIDRFSTAAAKLMVRTASNGMPSANAAINFDSGPFITTGLDRNGVKIDYYNFDIQSTTPEDIYVFFKAGANSPIEGQYNVIPTIPGEVGYNDFWLVNKVTVPDNFVVNTLTNEAAIIASGLPITKTNIIVNCPVVPFGSTAKKSAKAGIPSTLSMGWYNDKAVVYFNFDEAPITTTPNGKVPTSPIYVIFNVDPSPSNPASGPASGFKTEAGNPSQTHNILATIPTDNGYSPLWDVSFLANSKFEMAKKLSDVANLAPMMAGATVNCPVVK